MLDHETKVYAAWCKDKNIRKSCASGGIFYSIAKTVIAHGGVAVGAAFDNDFQVRHIVVDDMTGLESLKRSKYVRSNMGGLFPQVKTRLEAGQIVLFSGTPCQVAALKRYIGEEFNNLICCSFFCYGTPEPDVYSAYLNSMEKHAGSRISSINFKDKRYGWDYYTTAVCFENKKEICKFGGDSYKELMNKGYSLSEPCMKCLYNATTVDADIVLGDFYTVRNYLKCRIPHDGVSCVICKTMQGQRILDREKNLKLISVDVDAYFTDVKPKNRCFDFQKRREFQKAFAKFGYDTACEVVGIIEKPLSWKRKLLAIRKRVGL